MSQADRIRAFRAMHDDLLVLPNAWDAPSARAIAAASAPAVATTSAGVAWALGRADGVPPPEGLTEQAALEAVGRIVAAVDLPVSADLESGYADTPEGVAATVSEAISLGISGLNLEDARDSLLSVDEQALVLAAVAGAVSDSGVPVFVNARTDVYLRAPAGRSGEELLEETIARGRAYANAGADGLFVPGLSDPDALARLVDAIDLPVNAMVGAGPVDLAALGGAGVRRVSWGPQPMLATYGWLSHEVRAVLADASVTGFMEGAPVSLVAP